MKKHIVEAAYLAVVKFINLLPWTVLVVLPIHTVTFTKAIVSLGLSNLVAYQVQY
jgi:hypothetical protein